MSDLVEVCVGKTFRVFMTKGVAKRFDKTDAKERARCRAWMMRFAEDGHELLDDTKLKNEGHFSTGDKAGTKVAVWAFKAWQLRVYGGVVPGNIFVCTEIDDSKKQNSADRDLLKAAAKKLAPYL
ncbi:hypothetical protein [Shinella sp. HZN7]|uniref:hypothetical protein n=1 Tax=Shinella sp. (strain HZN7) TaxID=879274 RepID=UPI0007DA971B|nr:hypothetical protein [Shinella sp. HZN7]ANH06258.1 hypothetical protein shn_20915 [Shinella sp. HZN7]MCA0339634.1 hypothetical protein [Pseudomonadota bacterium]